MTEDEITGWHHRFNGHEFDKLQEIVMDRKPGVLQSMRSQRVRWDLVTEQQQRCRNLYPGNHTNSSLSHNLALRRNKNWQLSSPCLDLPETISV